MRWLMAWASREAPTDVVALLRIGLALLLWARFGSECAAYAGRTPIEWLLTALFFPLTTAMLVGLWSRVSTGATAALLVAMWLFYAPELGKDFDHHHTRLLVAATLLLALTPCGGSWSIDRYRAVRRAEAAGQVAPEARGPRWGQDLLAVQVSVMYFWTAVDKTNPAFLSGERLENLVMYWYLFDYPVGFPLLPLCALSAWFVVILEYVLPFGLFVRRLQPALFVTGAAFHGVLFALFPVSTFTCTTLLLYLAYVDPDDLRAVLRRLA